MMLRRYLFTAIYAGGVGVLQLVLFLLRRGA